MGRKLCRTRTSYAGSVLILSYRLPKFSETSEVWFRPTHQEDITLTLLRFSKWEIADILRDYEKTSENIGMCSWQNPNTK